MSGKSVHAAPALRTAVLLVVAAFLLTGCGDESPSGNLNRTDAPVFHSIIGQPGAATLWDPVSVTVDESGNLYVVDGARIVRFAAAGGVASFPIFSAAEMPVTGSGVTVLESPTSTAATFTRYPTLVATGGDVYLLRSDVVRRYGPLGENHGAWPVPDSELDTGEPVDIAADESGAIYILDAGNHKILKLTAEGELLAEFGRQGTHEGEFEEPVGIAVEPGGVVYVSDSELRRIAKFDAEGSFLDSWDIAAGLVLGNPIPYRLAVAPDGNLLVLVLWEENMRWTVQKVSPAGELLDEWPLHSYFNDISRAVWPTAFAIDGEGSLTVSDRNLERVFRFSASGAWSGSVGRAPGDDPSEVISPRRLTSDAAGHVYVASPPYDDEARVQKIAPDGSVDWTLPVERAYELAAGAEGELFVYDGQTISHYSGQQLVHQWRPPAYYSLYGGHVGDLAVDRRGRVVLLMTSGLVSIHNDAGAPISNFTLPSPYVSDMTLGPDGSIYVVYGPTAIHRYSDRGELLDEFSIDETLLDWPRTLAVDRWGDLYVLGRSDITKFARGGHYLVSWELTGPGYEDLGSVSDMTVTEDGAVYVADEELNRILKFVY